MIRKLRDMISYFPVLVDCVHNGQLDQVDCNVEQARRLNHFINHMNVGDGARQAAATVLWLGQFPIEIEEEVHTQRQLRNGGIKVTTKTVMTKVEYRFHDYCRFDRANRAGYLRLLTDYMGLGAIQ